MNSAITTSSSEVAKANTAPAATPGAICGRHTRKNARSGPAPQAEAARSCTGSNPSSAASTVTTTKGTPSAAWAMTSPV